MSSLYRFCVCAEDMQLFYCADSQCFGFQPWLIVQ